MTVRRTASELTSLNLTYCIEWQILYKREQISLVSDMAIINVFVELRYGTFKLVWFLFPQVILEGVVGGGIYGDIAVDDLSLLGENICDSVEGNG